MGKELFADLECSYVEFLQKYLYRKKEFIDISDLKDFHVWILIFKYDYKKLIHHTAFAMEIKLNRVKERNFKWQKEWILCL